MNKNIPELFYYAENLMGLGNFDVILPEDLEKIHQANWDEIEPRTKAQNDENGLCPDELLRGLRDLVNHVQDRRGDHDLHTKVGQFFESCVISGYRTMEEIVNDTGLATFDSNDLRSVFFKYIHPALAQTMPVDFKPNGLKRELDDSGFPKTTTPPSESPRGADRPHHLKCCP